MHKRITYKKPLLPEECTETWDLGALSANFASVATGVTGRGRNWLFTQVAARAPHHSLHDELLDETAPARPPKPLRVPAAPLVRRARERRVRTRHAYALGGSTPHWQRARR